MGQVYHCWWRVCREINVFSRLEYHVVYVLYPFVTYFADTPSYITVWYTRSERMLLIGWWMHG
jgi:hypothetical protein